jgi:hypothetical protein
MLAALTSVRTDPQGKCHGSGDARIPVYVSKLRVLSPTR